MAQPDTAEVDAILGSPNGDTKPARSQNGKKRRHRNAPTKAAAAAEPSAADTNGSVDSRVRRSSVSKPARDIRDEPAQGLRSRKRAPRRKANGNAAAIATKEEETMVNGDAEDGPLSRALTTSSRSDTPVVDFDGLSRPSVGTRERLDETPEKAAARLERMKGAVRTLLECVGEDADREGLLATPERYAKALLGFTAGYQQNVRDIVNNAIFQEGHNEMVIVRDIDVHSICEHHLVPFTGKMHIGYIPRDAVIGISKLPRIADMFARRLQIQERLTREVANAIFEILEPQGVAVVMESSHLCMVMRGVQKVGSTTVTSCVLGCFESREATRNEFLSLVGVNRR